jgi:heme o synthase
MKRLFGTYILFSIIYLVLGTLSHYFGANQVCNSSFVCSVQEYSSLSLIYNLKNLFLLFLLFSNLIILTFSFIYKSSNLNEQKNKFAFNFIIISIITWAQFSSSLVKSNLELMGLLNVLTYTYFINKIWIYFNLFSRVQIQHVDTKSYSSFWKVKFSSRVYFVLPMILVSLFLDGVIRYLGAEASCGLGFKNSILCFDPSSWTLGFWANSFNSKINIFTRYFDFSIFIILLSFYFVKFKFIKNIFVSKINSFIKFKFILVILSSLIYFLSNVLLVSLNNSPYFMIIKTFSALLLCYSLINLYLTTFTLEKSINLSFDSFYSDLLTLTKPKLALLAVVTSFIGQIVAPSYTFNMQIVITLLAILGIVAASCAANCLIEKDVDQLMQRTMARPIPMGRLDNVETYIFIVLMMLPSVIYLFSMVNVITGLLGLLAIVTYIFIYTPLKRKSTLSLWVGALSGAIPPLMGWTSVMGEISFLPIILFSILFIWQIPHFHSISIVHMEDYQNADLKTHLQTVGIKSTKYRIIFYTVLLFLISLLPLLNNSWGLSYLIASLSLGLAFVVLSMWGFNIDDNFNTNKKWAKNYFYASIAYLPGVFFALIVFH